MAPMMISADWQDNPVYIYKQGVTMTATPDNQIKQAYLQTTSPIVTSSTPGIIT